MRLRKSLDILVNEKSSLMLLTKNFQVLLKEKLFHLNDSFEILGSLNKYEQIFKHEILNYNEVQERFVFIYDDYEQHLIKEVSRYNEIQERFVKTCNDIPNINFNSDMQYILFNNFLLMHFNDQGHGRDEEYENIELTVEELILLYKGVAIGEVYLRKGFCHGFASVSGTTVVLHKLITINHEKAKEAWEWTRNFALCNDEYLPNPNIDF